MQALLRREEASPSPVYGARLLSGFRLIPVAGSNPAASAIWISKEIHGQTEPGSGSVCCPFRKGSRAAVGRLRDRGSRVVRRDNEINWLYSEMAWGILAQKAVE